MSLRPLPNCLRLMNTSRPYLPLILPGQNARATRNEEVETKYWRMRAFDDLAERVRDTVRKGQTALRLSFTALNAGSRRKRLRGALRTGDRHSLLPRYDADA